MPPKRVARVARLHIQAGEASPARVGKDIGPLGINMMEFCKGYNEATATQRGHVVPVDVTVFEDRTFTLSVRTPTSASLLRQAAGVEKGSARTGEGYIGSVSRTQLREIASLKMRDLNTADLDAAVRVIAGTARSMGLAVAD
jgi:large subunit ribosomal protein L11